MTEQRPKIIVPGFHDMPHDVYHSQMLLDRPALSYGIAKALVNQSPRHAHYLHPLLGAGDKARTRSMDEGQVAHAILLGQEHTLAIGEFADWRTNAAKDFRETAIADGLTPVLACKLTEVYHLRDAFNVQVGQSDCHRFYDEDADTELTGIWQSGHILCQSRFDRVNRAFGEIYDVKLTTNVESRALMVKILNMGYDIQHEFYTRSLESLIPALVGRVTFTFLFVESEPPYTMTPVTLSGAGRALAKAKVDKAFEVWGECLHADKWPGYSSVTMPLEPPAWALNDIEEMSL